MKTLFATLMAMCVLASAQTGPAGRWKVEGAGTGFPWEIVLRVEGTGRVLGAVSSCTSGRRAVEIFDGKINGSTIQFKCTSGQRTIVLTGALSDEGIVFTWEKQVPVSVDPWEADPVFGGSSPSRFIARRAPNVADALADVADHARRYPAVTFDRILHAHLEPENWLTYSANLFGHRHTLLSQITPNNVKNLELAWIWQAQSPPRSVFEATALVADGVLYTVQPPNDVVALDAATGRVLWIYSYAPSPRAYASGGGGRPNRGLAMLGDTLFLGTLDAHLLAINAYTGKLVWNSTVADAADPICEGSNCYVLTHAPLVVKDKVIVGVAGSEGPIRGFISAFNVKTGEEVWRFHTVPGVGEPGNQTWSGDSWKTGGAGVWNTGSYDPDLNLTYWGTGNPYPVSNGDSRLGDNLYSDSVVALDADTGKLKWHYQFTPHDTRDWDAAQIPVLTNLAWQGRQLKVLLWANRNGLIYALDRTTGEFLYGKPFVEVNWMDGFDEKGRPREVPDIVGSKNVLTLPGTAATNWYPPSYSPSTGLFYVSAWERGSIGGTLQRGPGYGAMRAFDPKTGEKEWEFKRSDALFSAGALSTASGVLFTGVSQDPVSQQAAAHLAGDYFYALDARTGQLLWQMSLAGRVASGPMSYSVSGKQYVAVAAGNTLFAFALRQ